MFIGEDLWKFIISSFVNFLHFITRSVSGAINIVLIGGTASVANSWKSKKLK